MTTITIRILFAVAAAAAFFGCAQQNITLDSVGEPQKLGGAERVVVVDHIWVASQPDTEALKLAKAEGVRTVINLRHPNEMDWNEARAVEALGMRYHNVPINGRGDELDPVAMAKIHRLVRAEGDRPVLVHCRSGNRVGGWLATYLMDEQGASRENALAVGKKAGIAGDVVAEWVEKYRRP